MKIVIKTIPHADQYYPTVGDWFFTNEKGERSEGSIGSSELVICVSDLGDWRKELLVGLHELVEVAIAHHRGITVAQVDAFDKAFEVNRQLKLDAAKSEAEEELLLIDEPGDAPGCPVGREHSVASGVERILAALLEVDWAPYEKQIEML